jgi:cytochrome c-type biogenesis protein CcmH
VTRTSPRTRAIATSLRTGATALLITLAAAPLALAPAIAPAASAAAVAPRASLTDVESYLMCTSCREPLQVAQSPQADSERAYIRALIAQGETKSQIIDNMVAQYGPAVLGKPPAQGFNLTVYIIPPAILVLGAGILAFTLPRWRRRTRAAARTRAGPVEKLDPADARRLDQELSQFRG